MKFTNFYIPLKFLILFLIGGITYYGIEIAWRGYSHPSMFIFGGICFVLIGEINKIFGWNMSLLLQCAIASVIITCLEFTTGCVVNVWLSLNVWDYSNMKFNLMGQICPQMIVVWYFLSVVAILFDDFIRWKLFKEDKPRYILF